MDPRAEAWKKLTILCDTESLKGVLEFWEDKMETRSTLEELEEAQADRKEGMIQQIGRLENALHNQRDSNSEARHAFDAKLDELELQTATTEAAARQWMQRCQRLEGIASETTSKLSALTHILTSRTITERVSFSYGKELRAKGKHLDDVAQALVVLQTPTVAKVARFNLTADALKGRSGAKKGDGSDVSSDDVNEGSGGSDARSDARWDARTGLSDGRSEAATSYGKRSRGPGRNKEQNLKGFGGQSVISSSEAAGLRRNSVLGPLSRNSSNGDALTQVGYRSVGRTARPMRVPASVQILLGLTSDEPTANGTEGEGKRVKVREEDLIVSQASLLCSTCELGMTALLDVMGWGDEQLTEQRPRESPQINAALNFRLPLRLPEKERVVLEQMRAARLTGADSGQFETNRLGGWAAGAGVLRQDELDELALALQEEEKRMAAMEAAELAAEEAEATEAAEAAEAAEAERRKRAGTDDDQEVVDNESGAKGTIAEMDERGVDVGGRLEIKLRELKTLVTKLGNEEGQRRASHKVIHRSKPKQQVNPKVAETPDVTVTAGVDVSAASKDTSGTAKVPRPPVRPRLVPRDMGGSLSARTRRSSTTVLPPRASSAALSASSRGRTARRSSIATATVPSGASPR